MVSPARLLIKIGTYIFVAIVLFIGVFIFYTIAFIYMQGYLPMSFAKQPYSDVIRSEELDWAMVMSVVTLTVWGLMHLRYHMHNKIQYLYVPLILCILVALYGLFFLPKVSLRGIMNQPPPRTPPSLPADSIFGIQGQ